MVSRATCAILKIGGVCGAGRTFVVPLRSITKDDKGSLRLNCSDNFAEATDFNEAAWEQAANRIYRFENHRRG